MALTSGTKLGAYEIQSPLGAVGMGKKVYPARDTRLARTVAIKTFAVAKRFSRLIPIAAAILASGLDTPRSWVEVRSPNFTVITDSTEKQGRLIAGQFERMRSILQGAYPQIERDGDYAVVILAIKDKKEFRALEPKTYLGKGR